MSERSKKFSVRWPTGVLEEVERYRLLFKAQFGVTISSSKAIVQLVQEGLRRQQHVPAYHFDPEEWVHLPGKDDEFGACGLRAAKRPGRDTSDVTCPSCSRIARLREHSRMLSP